MIDSNRSILHEPVVVQYKRLTQRSKVPIVFCTHVRRIFVRFQSTMDERREFDGCFLAAHTSRCIRHCSPVTRDRLSSGCITKRFVSRNASHRFIGPVGPNQIGPREDFSTTTYRDHLDPWPFTRRLVAISKRYLRPCPFRYVRDDYKIASRHPSNVCGLPRG